MKNLTHLPRMMTPQAATAIPPPGTVYVFPSWTNLQGSVSVRHWRGYFIDTTASTTQGINEAITELAKDSRTSGHIQLFEGTYTVTGTITNTLDNLTISGVGNGTVLTNSGAITTILELDSTSGCTIRDLKIVAVTGSSVMPLSIKSSTSGTDSDLRIQNVHIVQEHATGSGLEFSGQGSTLDRITIRDVTIRNTASSSSTSAESVTLSGLEPETNSYTDTATDDGVYHIVEDDSTSTDFYYQFDVGATGVPVLIDWNGYAQGAGNIYTVWVYNYVTVGYEQVDVIEAAAGTTEITRSFKVTGDQVGTGGSVGKVRLRFLSTDGTALATDYVNCSYRSAGSSIGFNSNVGSTALTHTDLRCFNLYIDGFFDGFNNNSGSNSIWEDCVFDGCRFSNNTSFGARFYHMGEIRVTNCLFEANGAGAYFDQGATNQESNITNSRFINNTVVALYGEEWANTTVTGCVIKGNKHGLWLSSARQVSIVGCSIVENTEWGVNTDKNGTLDTLYTLSNQDLIQDNTITGCIISRNSKNGMEIKGADKGFVVSGCVITRNGTFLSSAPATSGYADITISTDGGAATNDNISIVGCTFGNMPGSPDDGGAQYGIKQTSGSTTTVNLRANLFVDLEDAISITGGNMSIVANHFDTCNAITLGGGGNIEFHSNDIVGGTLNNSKWEAIKVVAPSFTDTTRPTPSTVTAGSIIWNTQEGLLNISDGTNWEDPHGNVT